MESNPGPPKPDPRQTRLSTSRLDPKDATVTKSNSPEPSLKDIMDYMKQMDARNRGMDKKLDDLRDDMNKKFTEFNEKVQVVQDECNELRRENAALKDELDQVKLKTDDLENRSRRNNLLFHGIKRSENESNDQCEQKVQNLLKEKLGFVHDIQFDRVHRYGRKVDSPIIARCVFYKDKMDIMKKRSSLKDTDFNIKEDFSDRVRKIRKELYPYLQDAVSSGKKASIVYDHLIVGNEKFVLSEDRASLVKLGRKEDSAVTGGASVDVLGDSEGGDS